MNNDNAYIDKANIFIGNNHTVYLFPLMHLLEAVKRVFA